ncbi:MAG: flavodoxin family protein [archaeon]
MSTNKVLIICQSVHHGNTLKVAKVIANELNADINKPSEVDINDFDKYDLIGFGSGIYNGKHHISLFNLIKDIKTQKNKKVFIFSTASICYKKMHESLRKELLTKGFYIINEFICKGFIDYSYIKYFFGGLNKKRPNEKDLKNAKEFALKIKGSF